MLSPLTAVKRILVVDDEETIREVVRACLEDIGGWQVTLAASGQSALAAIATRSPDSPFDAILLDISMPDLDGLEIFSQLQRLPPSQIAPVVLLTAKVLSDDLAQFQQLGVAGIITKPFDPLRLCGELAALLGWAN